jgi:two-component system nitrate/nitrite sensor histidine kinase NarX
MTVSRHIPTPAALAGIVYRRAILLGLALALLTMTVIGVVGMTASVLIVEKVRGSASAINVSGSLRMQSHRMGGLVLAGMMEEAPDREAISLAMERFEASLRHPSLRVIESRAPESDYASLYRHVREDWESALKPLLNAYADRVAPASETRHRELLARIDQFVADINRMVAQLEHDTEAKISQLRTLLAFGLGLTLVVVLGVLYGVSKRVVMPLNRLVLAANAIAKGDFTARAAHTGADELGRVGEAFNFMADELTKLYVGLEQRVNEKTEQLTRSNRSLELLYHCIARLYNAPVAPETYRAMLNDLELALGLRHSLACLLPEGQGTARILASTVDACPEHSPCAAGHCADCAMHDAPWEDARPDGLRVRAIPLKDAEQQYGVLKITLPPGRVLEAWQEQLLEALARHIGIALGIAHQAERERRLALMDERAVIARELHDSLAQALSYMKIQVVLLQQALASEAAPEKAEAILLDLREGINSAYRQLRELLATFRLRMEGDFANLLDRTADEFARRGGLSIDIEQHIGDRHLSPSQEIHVLQIVREALNNVLRHAHATHAWVTLDTDAAGGITVTIDDDGVGLARPSGGEGHYGMAIMRERAQGLKGSLAIQPRAPRGTRVRLHFDAGDGTTRSAFQDAPT